MEKEKFSNIDYVIKKNFFLSDEEAKLVRVFVPIKPFQPVLIFVGKTWSLHYMGMVPPLRQALALLANTKPDLTGLQG
jgi:hypothetical protein